MTPEVERWDPSQPVFLTAVFRTLLGLSVVTSLLALLLARPLFSGVSTGAALGLLLYLIALQAGSRLAKGTRYGQAMLWLIVQQCLLWVGMAIILIVLKVNPIGFVVGVSTLPLGIVLALAWFALQKRRYSS